MLGPEFELNTLMRFDLVSPDLICGCYALLFIKKKIKGNYSL